MFLLFRWLGKCGFVTCDCAGDWPSDLGCCFHISTVQLPPNEISCALMLEHCPAGTAKRQGSEGKTSDARLGGRVKSLHQTQPPSASVPFDFHEETMRRGQCSSMQLEDQPQHAAQQQQQNDYLRTWLTANETATLATLFTKVCTNGLNKQSIVQQ